MRSFYLLVWVMYSALSFLADSSKRDIICFMSHKFVRLKTSPAPGKLRWAESRERRGISPTMCWNEQGSTTNWESIWQEAAQFSVISLAHGLMHHKSPISKGNSNKSCNALAQVCSFGQSGLVWSYSRVFRELDWWCQLQAITVAALVHLSVSMPVARWLCSSFHKEMESISFPLEGLTCFCSQYCNSNTVTWTSLG